MPDYGKTRSERLAVVHEAIFNDLAQAANAGTDSVPILPGLSIPSALRTYQPSEERQATAGIRDLIKRKKAPSQWTIPVYSAGSDTVTVPPKYGLLLKKGFGVETIGGASVTYSLVTDPTELSNSLWHYADNILRGQRGAVVNQITHELSGTAEGKITFQGFAANEVFIGESSLAAAIDAIVTTITLPAGESRRFQVGPLANDFGYIKIESEILKLSSINYGTDVLTVVRGQLGSTAAAHAINTAVIPWVWAVDPDAADVVHPIILGTVDLGTVTGIRVVSFTQVINNNLEPRMDEYAADTLTGYRPAGKRTVTGQIRMYLRRQNQAFLSDLERELEVAAVIRAGSTGTAASRLTINMPRFLFRNMTIGSGGPEFEVTGDYQALETATGNDETNWVYD